MCERFTTFMVHCSANGHDVIAKVLAPDGQKLQDNIYTFVYDPCEGCTQWDREKIQRLEQELTEEWGERSGIELTRENLLEQHIVYLPRLDKDAEHDFVVAYCSPIGAK